MLVQLPRPQLRYLDIPLDSTLQNSCRGSSVGLCLTLNDLTNGPRVVSKRRDMRQQCDTNAAIEQEQKSLENPQKPITVQELIEDDANSE